MNSVKILITNQSYDDLVNGLRRNEQLRMLDVYADYEIPEDERDGYMWIRIEKVEE